VSTPTEIPGRLSDSQLADVLELTKQADSVELKTTVLDSDRRAAVTALGMDPLQAKIRQVFFFDTPDLVLDRHGVVVRARRIQGRPDDSVVKLRPVVPGGLQEARRSKNLVVEVDAMPGGFVCSASMKGMVDDGDVQRVVAGRRSVRKLYSREQRTFFSAHAPAGVELDDLSVLGPITVLKLKFSPRGYAGRLVAEMWFYPSGAQILELSAKCAPADAFQVAAELRAFLVSRGLDLSGEQQTKTRTALELFAGTGLAGTPR
jgi:hypothetical protein